MAVQRGGGKRGGRLSTRPLLCLERGPYWLEIGITDHLPLEGGGRPAPAGRAGVTAVPQIRPVVSRWRRRHPTPDCRRQSDPPPSGEGVEHVLSDRKSD